MAKNIKSTRLIFVSLALLNCCFSANAVAQNADPLPSWTTGATKTAIVDFVKKTTTENSPDFVPLAERISTFDNDGTLWAEQPLMQGAFALTELNKLAEKDPSIRQKQPFKAAFEHDKEYLKEEGMPAILTLLEATHAGMSQKDFESSVKTFFASAKSPTLNRPFRETTYKPMVELLQYLRANGFKTYICSGGGVDFVRVVSQELYGIPPEQVIGSSMKKTFHFAAEGCYLERTGKLSEINDKAEKPVNIDLHIGIKPILAAGNERTGGDIAMLTYCKSRKGPSLQLLVNHNDAKREFAYEEADNASLKNAADNGWTVISIKDDWNQVF